MPTTKSKNARQTSGTKQRRKAGSSPNSPGIQALWANRIRSAFRLECRTPRSIEIHGKSYDIGGPRSVIPPEDDPVWGQLAEQLLARGIDGVEYVMLWFARWNIARDLLHPRALLGEWLIDRFGNEHINHIYEYDTSPTALARQKDYAKMSIWRSNQWSPGPHEEENKDWVIALTSEPSLTPLFCYCKTRQMEGPEFEAIAVENEVEAVIEYLRNQVGFDEHWGDFIPADFKEQVVPRVYREIFDEGNIPAAKRIRFDPWRV